MKRLHSATSSDEGQAAFTMVEAAAAIAVLTLLAIIGGFSIRVASEGFEKIVRSTEAVSRLLHLETALRQETGKVSVPYWEGPLSISSKNGNVSIPFVGGDPKALLVLSEANGFVFLDAPEFSETIGPFDSVEISTCEDESRGVIGLTTTASIEGLTATIKTVFSSLPLPVGAN